ncbi:tRNA pseudouridine(55) synthase TruB [Allobacillus sp. GCM10007491]|uniref:tRNA pseudouridine synthase B n=1 Tax=Allobacillus saliphilus TaxID=2912308 RepID=A0A941CSK5_9BACI|nr:tRNA pseudouridine(55) synthase TruB [Allobacillus saliphilus]MBR7552934.1 tRNA pseudouridine(55) synthase TruB [Allobacillus saliphilus]
MNGVIPLWKPAGMTSHDCVARIRGLLRMKRVGHTGTLDPAVEGVLPICIGKATKIVSLLTDSVKVYEAEISLGKLTTTEDQTGEVVQKADIGSDLTYKACVEALESFQGNIRQIPPMYSAVRVDGRRLYEYAREGIEVDRPERTVTIHEIEMLSKELERVDVDDVRFVFRATCSSGTYIRTLCVNIGEKLGLPAHLSKLIRTEAATIQASETVTFQEIEEAIENDRLDECVQTLSQTLTFLPTYTPKNEEEAKKFKQGQVFPSFADLEPDSYLKIEQLDQKVIAIYQNHPTKDGLMKPFKVFE